MRLMAVFLITMLLVTTATAAEQQGKLGEFWNGFKSIAGNTIKSIYKGVSDTNPHTQLMAIDGRANFCRSPLKDGDGDGSVFK